MAARWKRQSLLEEGLAKHIALGKAAQLWPHDYEAFELMRHTYGLTIAQMQRNFNLKAWSTMREWFRVDDAEHAERQLKEDPHDKS